MTGSNLTVSMCISDLNNGLISGFLAIMIHFEEIIVMIQGRVIFMAKTNRKKGLCLRNHFEENSQNLVSCFLMLVLFWRIIKGKRYPWIPAEIQT
jgi:hypothetical protein